MSDLIARDGLASCIVSFAGGQIAVVLQSFLDPKPGGQLSWRPVFVIADDRPFYFDRPGKSWDMPLEGDSDAEIRAFLVRNGCSAHDIMAIIAAAQGGLAAARAAG